MKIEKKTGHLKGNPFFKGLRFKFVSAVSVLLLITLGLAAFYSSRYEQQLLENSIDEKAQALGKFIALISPEAIFAFDITTLDRFVKQICDDLDIVYAIIRNTQGYPLTTYKPTGIELENIQAYLQGSYHEQLYSVLTFPIQAQGESIGELQVVVDNTRLFKIIHYTLIEQLFIYLGIIVFLAVVIFSIFRQHVLRPINALMKGAHLISQGIYALEVKVYSDDEIGQLAKCFNDMAVEINTDREKMLAGKLRLEQEIKVREKVEKQLRMVSQAVEQSPISIVITDLDGRIEYVNPKFSELTGYSAWEVIGNSPEKNPMLEERHEYFKSLWNNISNGTGNKRDTLNHNKNGNAYWQSTTIAPIRKKNGLVTQFLALQEDISERKEAEKKLQLAASVFTHAREGISITDSNGNIVQVNDSFCYITGFSRQEVIGKNPKILKSGRHGAKFYHDMWNNLEKKGHWYGEIWNKRKNGEIYPEILTISSVCDSAGKVTYYVALFTDITEQKKHQEQLEHTAHYDALTNLPNRVLLADRMKQSLARSRRQHLVLAVVYLDLDGFKEVNDSFGHEVGDQLLINLSALMIASLREGDTIARIGGDEFVAVLNDLRSVEECKPLLQRLNRGASQPIHVAGRKLQVSASIGVSFFKPGNEIDPEQLIRQADQAMYQAKLSGKNRYHIFDSEQDRNVRGLIESINHIQQALHHSEFELFYQPKVNMHSGELYGVEALIRWRHPERGLLLPAVFMPVVEDYPIAIELGEWVIKTALRQMQQWQSAGLCTKVSINVGARQLQQDNFVLRLQEMLAEYEMVKPTDLELEILETSALEDIRKVSKVMNDCSEMGVDFALDDFGTGYSSLTYLKRLPATQLKVDRSFVKDMLDDPEDLAILEGVLGLATAFRREVIAEGVETEEHGKLLLKLGCKYAQGFAIARPMSAEDFIEWHKSWRPYHSWKVTTQVRHTDLSLLFAMVEHRAWVRGVKECLRGERLAIPVIDETQCRFSSWLNGEGKKLYSHHDSYLQITRLHTDIHQLASELLQNSTLERQEMETKLKELLICRDNLLYFLEDLIEE